MSLPPAVVLLVSFAVVTSALAGLTIPVIVKNLDTIVKVTQVEARARLVGGYFGIEHCEQGK